MRKLLALSTLAAFLFAVSGCGKSLEASLPGKYKLEVDMSGVPADKKTEAEAMKGFMSNVTAEFKADHTATLTAMGKDQPATWKIDGDKVVVTPKAGSKPTTLKSDDGGKTLVAVTSAEDEKIMGGIKLKFIKQ